MAIANTQVKQANRPQVSLTGAEDQTVGFFPLFLFGFCFLWVLSSNFLLTATILWFCKTFPRLRVAFLLFFLLGLFVCQGLLFFGPMPGLTCFPLFCLHLNWKLVFGHFSIDRLLIYHATFPFPHFFKGFSSLFGFVWSVYLGCSLKFLNWTPIFLFMTYLIGTHLALPWSTL